MRKRINKFAAFSLVALFLVLNAVPVFAMEQERQNFLELMDYHGMQVEFINEVPCGVTPVVVDCIDRLDVLIRDLYLEFNCDMIAFNVDTVWIEPGSSDRSMMSNTVAVDRQWVLTGPTVTLYVYYRAGSNRFSYTSAFTRMSGFSISYGWTQHRATAHIVTGPIGPGSAIEASATGRLYGYFVSPIGLIRLGLATFDFSGRLVFSGPPQW